MPVGATTPEEKERQLAYYILLQQEHEQAAENFVHNTEERAGRRSRWKKIWEFLQGKKK
jgi:hypothetical protein